MSDSTQTPHGDMGAGHSMQTSNDDFMSDNVLDEFLRIGGTPSDHSTELSNGEMEGGVQPAEVGEEGTLHSTGLSNGEISLESAAGREGEVQPAEVVMYPAGEGRRRSTNTKERWQ